LLDSPRYTSDSGWVLEIANGINVKGQIVGTGKHCGKTRAFVLTPRTQ
jgi:probable HAF family extracellular repeat protein